jgi:UDP-glucose 4-epimerase
MRLLLVGSGGFIGGHMLRALARRGIEVVELSSSAAGGIDPATGTFARRPVLEAPIDAVIFLSQWPSYSDLSTAGPLWAVNVASALAVATAARAAGASRFVYASTGNVYAPSFDLLSESSPVRRDNAYSLSKVHAEEALALLRPDLQTVCARLFTVYGPGQQGRLVANLAKAVLAGDQVTLQPRVAGVPDEGLRLSLGHVADVCDCLIALATGEDPGPVVNVAGDEPASLRRIASLIGAALDRQVLFRHGETARNFDLVADVSLLERHAAPLPTSLEDGIASTCAALPDTASR